MNSLNSLQSAAHVHQVAPIRCGRPVVTFCSRSKGARQGHLIGNSQISKKNCGARCKAFSDEGHAQIATASSVFWLLSQLPASAVESTTDFSKGSFSTESYVVTLGLFLLSLPGLWSQIKRAPKASIKRKTFEVAGPGKDGAESLDARARQIFLYFQKYNYEVKETGETITFAGTYAASRGQAAALVFYVFCGLVSTALVLSIALPFGGQNWYWISALSPLAGVYYWQKGTRQEDFKVKMVTADDEQTTDILVEGDKEEIERMTKELQLMEKGKIYVKGLLEK